jgi:hypothetical protein
MTIAAFTTRRIPVAFIAFISTAGEKTDRGTTAFIFAHATANPLTKLAIRFQAWQNSTNYARRAEREADMLAHTFTIWRAYQSGALSLRQALSRSEGWLSQHQADADEIAWGMHFCLHILLVDEDGMRRAR